MEYSALKEISPSNPSHQGTGYPAEDEVGRVSVPDRMVDTKKMKPSKEDRASALKNSETEVASTWPMLVYVRWSPGAAKRSGPKLYP